MSTDHPQAQPGQTGDADLNALTHQLTLIAEKAPSHQLMLIALISTYKAVALVHPCCTRDAAQVALQVGGDLLMRHLGSQPVGPLH